MTIIEEALAGTLESSDISVRVGPGKGDVDITLTSTVMAQFGCAIRDEIRDTLRKMGVANASVVADDKGALDCVIRARVQTAVLRAAKQTAPEWGIL